MTNRSARPQLDPFEFEVYQTQTYGAGMFEFESLNSFVPKGHTQGDNGTSSGDYASNLMYRTTIELSYGLTDKIEAGGYISLARPNGASFQYAGSKYRIRGSLFEQGELPVDLGWYVELEWHRIHQFDGNELEFEFKPLIEKNIGKFEIDLNGALSCGVHHSASRRTDSGFMQKSPNEPKFACKSRCRHKTPLRD